MYVYILKWITQLTEFMKKLSDQMKTPLLWRITYYGILFSVTYFYLGTLLDFPMSHSAFHFVLFFKSNWNKLIIMIIIIIMINITIVDTYPLK